MSKRALGGLILRNLRDLDAAARLLQEEVEIEVQKELDQTIDNWLKSNGWIGESTLNKDEYCWIAPEEWRTAETAPEDEDFKAWFELSVGEGDSTDLPFKDYFWLTRMCRAGEGMLGFRWKAELQNLGVKRRDWKNFVRSRIEPVQALGFYFEESAGELFLPIMPVEADQLAAAYEENAVSEALQPIHEALDKVLNGRAAFDAIIKDAEATFGGSGAAK